MPIQADPGPTLAAAHAALRAGRPDEARQLASQVRREASGDDAPGLQAAALLILAECESAAGKIRLAADLAQQAVHAFRLLHDLGGETDALTLLAHASTMLGRNEEAVESALLAVRLQDDAAPDSVQRIRALNYLGLAQAWSRQFGRAAEALDTAAGLADKAGLGTAAFQPRVNRVYAAVLQLTSERARLGQLPDTPLLRDSLEACRTAVEAADPQVMLPGTYIIGRALWGLLGCMAASWSRDFDAADRALADGHAWASRYGAAARMNATESWARAELHWARGELEPARQQAREMLAIAAAIEHQQLACAAHLLLAQLAEQLGDTGEALAEMRLLREREQIVRTDSLDSRERVVTWQLEIRRSEGMLRQLEHSSREYERLSMEDALTGIPNRRCFERALARQLELQPQRPGELWVAYLDIDGFKAINDRHGHACGDQVLIRVARILRSCVRERDLAARLAGDEFAVLLSAARQETAQRACERVEQAIAGERWDDLAEGLSVRASIGLASAQAGDTVATLLHRGDSRMYALKRSRGR